MEKKAEEINKEIKPITMPGVHSRFLKPDGKLYVSTPNVLSMKSRFRFFFQGFPYAFKPLEMDNYNGLQHVASLNLDQYNYLAIKHGFGQAEYDIDSEQRTSRCWEGCCSWYLKKRPGSRSGTRRPAKQQSGHQSGQGES